MLSSVKSQITYTLAPADVILKYLCESDFKSIFFIEDCKACFDSGMSFCDAWKSSIEKNGHRSCLKQEDLEYLKAFADVFGNTGKAGQTENCDLYISGFEVRKIDAHEKSLNAPKLYNSLSVLIGVLSVLLLI